MPHLESLGAGRWFGVFPVSGGKGYWGKEAKQSGYLIHLPTHCMPCPVCVCGARGCSFPLLAPAHLSSFSPQTPAPRCLQTPQPPAQAQSPLFHPHSEEPASHLPPLPWRSQFQDSPPPLLGPLSAWRVHHYVRKALMPLTAPPCPSEVCSFISSSCPWTSD